MLLLIPLVPILLAIFFIVRSIYKATIAKKLQTTITEDFKKEAEKHEKAGEFVSAAHIYENRLKEYQKAASLYEKGNNLMRAAMLYGSLGMHDKAKEIYERAGEIDRAAEVAVSNGAFEEAAKLYEKAGKKLDAAMMLEKAERKLAAVRLYREAGEYKRAASLLAEENMLKEAADMFGIALNGSVPETSNLDDYYTYAIMLEKAGEMKKAQDVFNSIYKVYSSYRDVKERIHITTDETDKKEISLENGHTTLKRLITNGRIEPKYSMKLWVQILKALQSSYKEGRPFGFISPGNTIIDTNNNINLATKKPLNMYIAPENSKGFEPDIRADIYSMGIVLYEMLTGNTEDAGSKNASEIYDEVPEWLDEIIIKCTRKVREDRYQNIEEIFKDIKALSEKKR
ncbi:MAG: hypothetical protein HY755_11605 [Nitrospirae bacterium]|nr:hypothetical protein [Nitrospirota bacterium]